MNIILGIDPGSRSTGFGLIKNSGHKNIYLASGHINVAAKTFPQRLQQIFYSINEIINTYKPTAASIEQVFLHKNVAAALKLGQARGAAITAITTNNLPLAEYSAREIKKAIVGYGAANKAQIQLMVKILLNLQGQIQTDAADALAIAICHANTLAGRKIL